MVVMRCERTYSLVPLFYERIGPDYGDVSYISDRILASVQCMNMIRSSSEVDEVNSDSAESRAKVFSY